MIVIRRFVDCDDDGSRTSRLGLCLEAVRWREDFWVEAVEEWFEN